MFFDELQETENPDFLPGVKTGDELWCFDYIDEIQAELQQVLIPADFKVLSEMRQFLVLCTLGFKCIFVFYEQIFSKNFGSLPIFKILKEYKH